MPAVDLSWILEEIRFRPGADGEPRFCGDRGRGLQGERYRQSRIGVTEAGDSSGGASEERERDEGHRWRSGRAGVRLERIVRNYSVKWLILFLVGKWKPMEDSERRDSMIRHMLQED